MFLRHGNGSGISSAPPTALIELRGVVKAYDSPAGRYVALKEINLQVERGEFAAIIGRSGSGKSTLLNMIAGIDRPSAGEIWMNNTPVHRLDEDQLARWRGESVGIIFQFFQLLPALTLQQNVILPMDLAGKFSPRERRARARELLDLVGLAEHADKLPNMVSGGQQQRAAIARAIANKPPILLADEPTGNLDSKTADAVFALFEQLAQQGMTILMVTHDAALAKRVKRTVLLSDGEVVNQYLAQAFPALNDKQLLGISRRLQPAHYEPGALILRQGEPATHLFVIMRGTVEVVLPNPRGPDLVVAGMGAGQYFGEIELMHHAHNIATIRAGESGGVDAAMLDQEAFDALLAESDQVEDAVHAVIDARLAENIAARHA